MSPPPDRTSHIQERCCFLRDREPSLRKCNDRHRPRVRENECRLPVLFELVIVDRSRCAQDGALPPTNRRRQVVEKRLTARRFALPIDDCDYVAIFLSHQSRKTDNYSYRPQPPIHLLWH